MFNILLLPDEIKIKIFQYLNGVDKIEILRVCEDFSRIGTDKNILKCMDFSYNYKFTLKSHLKYIGRKLTSNSLTYLNLNGIYWIPSAELRNCLLKFENLNALHVVDTQLSFRDLVTVLNKLEKVRKLAFSLRPDNCGDVYLINIETPITHLYVTFYSHQIKSLFRLMGQFSDLEELWMIEPSYPHKIILFDLIPQTQIKIPKISKRLVISQIISAKIKLNNFREYYVDGDEFYSNKWETIISEEDGMKYITVLEKSVTTNKCRRQNDEFNLEKYATINDIKSLRNSNNINDVKLFGLNFDKNTDIHLKPMLSELPCTKSVKHWRGPSNSFYDGNIVETPSTSLFKKRRVGVKFPKLNENNLFEKFTAHAPEMEHFEIIDENPGSLDSLKFAQNWINLKSLSITSPKIRNGKFIIDVLKNCSQLTRLKIQDNSFQDDFSACLCNALPYAINLKDFRYERKGLIPIDKLFESLKFCTKLERIHVQCRFAEPISKLPINTVLTVCENLVYFFLFISELPESVCRSIKQSILELNLKTMLLVFIRGQGYLLDTITYDDLPMFHIEDMVCQSNHFHTHFIRNCF